MKVFPMLTIMKGSLPDAILSEMDTFNESLTHLSTSVFNKAHRLSTGSNRLHQELSPGNMRLHQDLSPGSTRLHQDLSPGNTRLPQDLSPGSSHLGVDCEQMERGNEGRQEDMEIDELGRENSPDSMSPRSDLELKKFMTEKKMYRCQQCKYVTDRKNNLKRHIITMHEKCPKLLECCDVIFSNKAALREHVLSCHKNGYDCRVCGRNFCRKALLKRHITVHSGQKDYICSVCGYATSHKSNLDRHKRRHGPKHITSNDNSLLQNIADVHCSEALPIENSAPSPLLHRSHFTPSPEPYYRGHRLPLKVSWKNRCRTKYLFTNRILCTHKTNGTRAQPPCDNDKRGSKYSVDDPESPGDHKMDVRTQVIEKLGKITQTLSTRRLFPGLYTCKECEIVFENQLQLGQHIEKHHVCCPEPERPLTLQARKQKTSPQHHFNTHLSRQVTRPTACPKQVAAILA